MRHPLQVNEGRARTEELNIENQALRDEKDMLAKRLSMGAQQGSTDAKMLSEAHGQIANLQKQMQGVSEERKIVSMQCTSLEAKVKSLMHSLGDAMSRAGMDIAAAELERMVDNDTDGSGHALKEAMNLATVRDHIRDKVSATEEEMGARLKAKEMQMEERERAFLQRQRREEEMLEQEKKEVQEIKARMKEVPTSPSPPTHPLLLLHRPQIVLHLFLSPPHPLFSFSVSPPFPLNTHI